MRISVILLLFVLLCEFVVLMGVTRIRHRRLATRRPRVFHRSARQAPFRNQLHRGFGTFGQRRSTRAFPSQTTRTINRGVTLRPTFRTTFSPNTTVRRPNPANRLQAPPRRNSFTTSNGGAPGIRPPKGIADRLNRARLKDFMSLGAILLHRQRQ